LEQTTGSLLPYHDHIRVSHNMTFGIFKLTTGYVWYFHDHIGVSRNMWLKMFKLIWRV